MDTDKEKRKCVVCGAQVRNENPLTRTCDEVCTRARQARRTRVEQLAVDLESDARRAAKADEARVWEPLEHGRRKRVL